MTSQEGVLHVYYDLLPLYGDYIDAYDSIYKIKTHDESEILEIFQKIKNVLIGKYKIPVMQLLKDIDQASKYRLKYLKSLWALFRMIYDAYHPIEKIDNYVESFPKIINHNIQTGKEISFSQCLTDGLVDEFLYVYEEGTLLEAVMNDDLDTFKEKVQASKFDVSQTVWHPFEFGLNVLEICSYFGSEKVFKYIRSEYNSKISPKCLELSFIDGNSQIVKECMANQKPTNECIYNSCAAHQMDFMIYFLNNEDYKIIPRTCAKFRNLQAYLLCIDLNENINKNLEYSPLFHIPHICELLIQKGANVNAKGEDGKTPLHYTIEYDNVEFASLLIRNKAEVDAKDNSGYTPLHRCAIYNSTKIAKVLLENGCKYDEKVKYNEYAPLHLAAEYCHPEIASLLVKAGADVSSVDSCGDTPLHRAAMSNSFETAKILIENGCSIDAKDFYGYTALHRAAIYNSTKTAEILIECGCNVDAKDSNNCTPLHKSAEYNQSEIGQLLISRGADINAVNGSDETPLNVAISDAKHGMIQTLIENGADLNLGNKISEHRLKVVLGHCSLAIQQIFFSNNAAKYQISS